ncbi:MAG TPA: hypothetical protein PKO22_10065, partial [Treponemataceae bacterium]|nr:hypothetical protein [Treponemataceae bacterium]
NSVLKLAWSPNAYTVATNLTNAGATWTTMTIDSNLFSGSHVSMVASGGKLFLAYYDTAEADLKFARLTWTGNGTAPTVDGIVYVDRYLSVGSWTKVGMIDMDVGGAGTAQPYVAYYSDSYNGTKKPIRLAFPRFDAAAGSLVHGVTGTSGEDDTYSGDWEVVAVPTLTTPKGGMEQFNHAQLAYALTNGLNMPIVGWLGDKLEYARMQPNN